MTRKERRDWAERLGINEQYLYQCMTGRRDMGPAVARRIESESGGAITRRMVCHRTWQAIWPELAERTSCQETAHNNPLNAVGQGA